MRNLAEPPRVQPPTQPQPEGISSPDSTRTTDDDTRSRIARWDYAPSDLGGGMANQRTKLLRFRTTAPLSTSRPWNKASRGGGENRQTRNLRARLSGEAIFFVSAFFASAISRDPPRSMIPAPSTLRSAPQTHVVCGVNVEPVLVGPPMCTRWGLAHPPFVCVCVLGGLFAGLARRSASPVVPARRILRP